MSIEAAKEKILREIDLSQYIGQTVKLTRRSGNHVGLCPFHEEKSPSFTVFPKNYYCFGCQASGDVITFAMETKGLGFIDALKYLAASHGLDVGDLDYKKKNSAEDKARALIFRCLQTAQEYFVKELARPQAEPHRRYLEKRGFSPEQIAAYGFGYAPEGGGLSGALLKLGIPMAAIEKASLGYPAKYPKPGQSAGGYDFFQSRITIPIKDSFGRIIGFGGRTVNDHPAKYKNSKETDVFHKSKTLFGADSAAAHARKQNRVIVTEGYMDALQLWANGILETVAVLGTALTHSHIKALARMAKTVFLVFDGDKAGIRAGLKSVEAALTVPGLNIKVLSLPDGHDPDSYVAAHGREAFIAALGDAEDLFQFAIRHTLSQNSGLQVAQVVADTILPWLKTIADPITRSYLLTKLAQTTGIDQGTLVSQLDRVQRPPVEARGSAAQPQQPQQGRQVRQGAEYGRDASADHPSAGQDMGQGGPPQQEGPKQLDRLAVEFLAHLYFLPAEHADDALLQRAADMVVATRADVQRLVKAMVAECQRGGKPLADSDQHHWLGEDQEAWLPFFTELRGRRAFFETSDPKGAVEKIVGRAELTKIKNDISMLKAQLAADPSSLEILSALGKLTGQRLALEKNLT